MAEATTELDLVVGSMITMRPDEDREAYEEEFENLQDVQSFLREEGIEVDLVGQPGTEVWEGGIGRLEDLYLLKLLAAHLEQGHQPQSVLNSATLDGEEVDEVLANVLEGVTPTRFAHLINHQGEGGYYLPVEFAEPIWLAEEDEDEVPDEDTAVSFGSSVALLRELTELEQMFGERNVPPGGYSQALAVLKTAAQQSISNGLPIILW